MCKIHANRETKKNDQRWKGLFNSLDFCCQKLEELSQNQEQEFEAKIQEMPGSWREEWN